MNIAGERWPVPPAIRSGHSSRGPRSAPRRAEEALGEAPRDGASSHTITCRSCEATVRVPLRRRFLCDTCFHDDPSPGAGDGF